MPQTTQRRYTGITREEFEQFLGNFVEFQEVDDTDAEEVVYSVNLPHDELEVRIFSTIQNGRARDCGSDAIRTVLWHTEEDCPVGGRVKTLRIETWRSNLRPKVEDLVLNWREAFHGHCPDCRGGVLQLRSGQYGDFLGCSNYPRCSHTQDA